MDISAIHKLFLSCSSVSIDTRKIEANSMFVAIKGDRFDANTFAKEAIDKGASYVIIDNEDFYINDQTILVEDSLETLQKLAQFHRNYLKLPIVALTGSNGKTTTKELIQVVLAEKFNTKATVGNLNNHIGVPLTLLSFTKDTEIGIVEMGANHQKEIEFLCELATPNYGYITNFGKAHLEGFGGVEGVIKGKSEMYHYLRASDGLAFVNLEDAIQLEKSLGIRSFSFGIHKSHADVNIAAVKADPFVAISFNDVIIKSQMIGLYNANNVNAAITIGKYLEVDELAIKTALEGYVPENNRSQLMSKGTNKIIMDAYNANPSSMAVAIQNFVQLQDLNKVMILGDMFELGEESLQEHKALIISEVIGDDVKSFFVGENFYENRIVKSNFEFYKTFADFEKYLKDNLFSDSMILIKGSRGMALERSLNYL
ncbi:UDP-N-acetylmuramoyl-tripeptide--D-alanyl-D-alanine ligase [Flavobacterium algicola]|uniref:UDP-N-acetylmuramoyl-tripeptide--D-alanyl-D- alanine ligase n=1 Tax=Flavobacterium algicola TaxID=556529 RepID=UPI001EFE86F2|nr:UDP-N-acetylmuramoyl-tripeptide--D-alanyl-D-alanine ligase [Flavobacterium algicola]MCG9794044.1 UDP-N-acetylmuramoyl-tripeptide--D-alanyl-D-alanine ligase [Flavobacterium algicola]